MLTPARIGWVALLAVLLLSLAREAEATPVCGKKDPTTGTCIHWIGGSVPAPQPRPEPKPARPPTPQPPRVCTAGPVEVPCHNTFGTWLQTYQMWCRLQSPQPPLSDPAWQGRTTGRIMTCVRPQGPVADPGMAFTTWLPDANDPQPPPDPETLAWAAFARLDVEAITIASAPPPLETGKEVLGFVGIPIWLWAHDDSPNSRGPLTSEASERGHTVHITAHRETVVWDLDDGASPVTCKNMRPFNPRTMNRETPVVCGRQQGYEHEGEYTITATSHWRIDWNGMGRSGTLTMPLTSTATLRIGEAHALVTNGGNQP